MTTQHEPHEHKKWRAIDRISHYIVVWLPLITAFAFAGLFLLPYATLALVSFALALYVWSDIASKARGRSRFAFWAVFTLLLTCFGLYMTVQQVIVWIWGYPPTPGN